MGDPLYSDGVGLAVVLITLLKVLITFGLLLVGVMLMVWFDGTSVTSRLGEILTIRGGFRAQAASARASAVATTSFFMR